MNLLDRAIAAFAPRAGLKRAQAQLALDAVRKYDAAKGGRRQSGWNRPSTSGNTEILGAATTLRNTARELVRNNPYAKKAKAVYVANLVGEGIIPSAATGVDRSDKLINQAFADWCGQADSAGLLDFYGLQALMGGAIHESGEVLYRYRDRLLEDGLRVPMQLQVLEPDYLDTTRFGRGEAPAPAENVVNGGIEFDPIGRRVAYYLWSTHPGDNIFIPKAITSKRILADQVGHVFPAHLGRPGDIRGVTAYHAVAQALADLGDYMDAEGVRKKIEACLAAFVKSSAGVDAPKLGQESTDPANPATRLERFKPGMIGYLQPGEDVVVAAPGAAGGIRDYAGVRLHEVATGLNVTYEDLTGDLSGTNYSSYRAGHLVFRRAIEMDRALMFVPMACAPIWRRFVGRLVIAGEIRAKADGSHLRAEWSAPKFESVDPKKDAEADKDEVRSGFMAPQEAIRRRGYNPEKVLADITAWNAALDKANVILDTDPRNTNARGSAVPPAEAPAGTPAAAAS